MFGNWSVWLLAAVVVAVPLTATSAAAPPDANASTAVTTDPGGSLTAERWETLTVTVRANATNVTGYQSELAYDPNVLQVREIAGTDDFDAPVAATDNTNGSIVFNQIRSGAVANPVLAELTVQVIGTGGQRSDLSVVARETTFSNATGATFEPDSAGGVTVAVQSGGTGTERTGDVDQSGLGADGPIVLLLAVTIVGLIALRYRHRL